ncbi:EamA/RhaT family transporter [Williamsia phyllosphaerae]|uniref:Integral membrane protein n=1 Tax=Williamsia phyllosphaerae TaxID=885042 RepID=A0ABQ1UBD4_9NOCA|nr:EamA/RhaT family transporter [Williamsia phyllosphaerae]GGF13345.1 putative integral membrane protein [Williamsia phyllosphaerae]
MFVIGIVFASLAALGYGLSSVLRALGARRAAVTARDAGGAPGTTAAGGPSIQSTAATLRDPAFLVGTALVVLGFGGGAIAARFLPLFLSQTIVSANLIVTALLGTAVLGIRLHTRDWIAISAVIASLCMLGFSSARHPTEGAESFAFHWGLFGATVAIAAAAVYAIYRLGPRGSIIGGAAAGLLFGIIAIAVRILGGIDPFDPVTLLTDPAAWTIAIAGAIGFYVHTVALQLGAVNGVTAVLVVGETAAPGIIGVLFLGDEAEPGLGWLAIVGFIGAVIGAIAVAYYGSSEADHFGEAPPTEGGWRRRPKQRTDSAQAGPSA